MAGFDNCRNEEYSDMLGTRFFNTLCKKVSPSDLSNKIFFEKLELAGFDS